MANGYVSFLYCYRNYRFCSDIENAGYITIFYIGIESADLVTFYSVMESINNIFAYFTVIERI